MRELLALAYLCTCALIAAGDEPVDDEVLTWQPAFAAVSPSEPFSLVVLLITNDDAFAATEPAAEQDAGGQDAGEPDAAGRISPWCRSLLGHAYRKVLAARPDLTDRCCLQYLAAGTPRLLTGGSDRNQPARALVAICNSHYQLLSLAVGVPDASELLTMIEDAQEVQSLITLNGQETAKITAGIADRSKKRISRRWRDALSEILAAMNAAGGQLDETSTKTLGRIALTFQEVYFSDVQLRFGLTQAADQLRLVVLEQHFQTRRPWCDAMMPFLAGTDFTHVWKPLTEAVWHVTPVVHDAQAGDLLAWWDTQAEHERLVLALEPPLLLKQQTWPPANLGGIADKRGLGWTDLQSLLLEFPYRSIDNEQLAALIRDRGLEPLDIQFPTRTRYLFFEPGQMTPFVIREGDLPSKSIRRIKRATGN